MKEKSEDFFNKRLSDNEEEVFSLLDILIFLMKYLKNLIIFSLLSMVTVSLFTIFFTKPVYTSSSKIMSSNVGRSSQASGIAAQFGIKLTSDASETKWPYVEILESRSIAKSILSGKLTFGENNRKLLDILINKDEDFGQFEKRMLYGIELFLDRIKISEDLLTGVLLIRSDAHDPLIAKQINMALIEELDSFQRVYNKTKTSKAKKFIEERILDVESDLIIAEEKLKTFRDQNRRIENSPSLQLEVNRLTREVTVLIGVFTTLKQQLETTKIEEVKESDYVMILDSPEIPTSSSKPNKKFLVILSGFLGLLIGVFYSIIIDFIKYGKKNDLRKIHLLKQEFLKNFSL